MSVWCGPKPKMYEESSCFDPNAMIGEGTEAGEDTFPQMVSESEAVMSATHAYSYSSGEDAANANANANANAAIATSSISSYSSTLTMETIPQQNPYNCNNTFNTQFVEELYSSFPNSTTTTTTTTTTLSNYHTPTPDLLNLLHLPKPSYPFPGDSTNVSSVSLSYDPYLHLNLQQPTLRDLLPHMPPPNDFAFPGGDDIQAATAVAYQDFGNEVVDFTLTQDVGKKRGGKRTKHFTTTTTTTERQRRVDLSSKFDALKELIPNPSKSDRASVVGDAINYIRELKRTVEELKLLVEKKRQEKERVMMMMRHKVETEGGDDSNLDPDYSESLRSSWIQRKSKDTEVDVRIVDNEVTIKLVQRKKIDCLVHVSHLLDQLNLDLQHVAGGHIGDFCSYLFNTKICEGSSVYASAIANKLIQVMDTSLAAASLA